MRRSFLAIIIFAATAGLSVALTRFTGGFALLWVSTGFLVPMLLPLNRKQRLIVLAGCGAVSMAITAVLGMGPSAAVALAFANIAEAVIDVAAIDLAKRRFKHAMSLQSVGVTYLTGVLVAPALTGIVAAITAHSVMGAGLVPAWTQWLGAHALGFVTSFPCAILIMLGKNRPKSNSRPGERQWPKLVGPLVMAAVCVICFGQSTTPLLFVPPIILIYVILLSEAIVAANMMAVLVMIGGGLTFAGYGPVNLMPGGQSEHLRFFQFYILCVALSGVPITMTIDRSRHLFGALRDSEARYRLMSDFSTDIVMISDRSGILRFVSPSIEQIGHYSQSEMIGQSEMGWIAKEHWPDIVAAHAQVTGKPGTTARAEFLGLVAGKHYRWFETHMRAIVREDGEVDGVCSMIRDIGQRKRKEAELAAAAMTDPLTGLGNRRAFEMMLAREDNSNGDSCVAMLDLDSFKLINDRHGHSAGDAVLRDFARIACSSVREGDFVARFGGEEFAIYLPDTSLLQAQLVCQRLRQRLAANATLFGDAVIQVTVSIGLGTLTGNVSGAIERADLALYQAKADGRNRLALAA